MTDFDDELVLGWVGLDEFTLPLPYPAEPRVDFYRPLALGLSIDLDLPSGGDCMGTLEGATATKLGDIDCISEIRYHFIENEVISQFWTLEEICSYMNQRQYQFLRDTSSVMKKDSVVTPAETLRVSIPDDVVSIDSLWWKRGGVRVHESQRWHELRRGDLFEADALLQGPWPNDPAEEPEIYTMVENPTLQVGLAPPTFSTGIIDLLYVYLSAAFDAALVPTNPPFTPGVRFTVPNEFEPAIKWGVMSDMLSKIGRMHDPARAQYCQQRYEEGVEAAKLLLEGFS